MDTLQFPLCTAEMRFAQQIWDFAELGYLETRSSGLLIDELEGAGFSIRPGVAGIPTAFVAEWGDSGPVIGLLAEFDALPGITQSAQPTRDPVADKHAGHACGHARGARSSSGIQRQGGRPRLVQSRRSETKAAFLWLKANNPYYAGVEWRDEAAEA